LRDNPANLCLLRRCVSLSLVDIKDEIFDSFSVNRSSKLKTIRGVWFFFYVIPLVGVFIAIRHGWSQTVLESLLISFLIISVPFGILPTIILYRSYLKKNKNVNVIYRKNSQTLTINTTVDQKNYSISDVMKIERTRFTDMQHPAWARGWQPLGWRNFGYIRIIFNNEDEVILTSLMLDINNAPFEIDNEFYKGFPSLPESYKTTRITKEQNEAKIEAKRLDKKAQDLEILRKEIDFFKTKFQSLSRDVLISKTTDNIIKEEARIAAQELLAERLKNENTTQ
jgi:hypothetical protein